ncbi:cd7 antigen-like isoform X2 [Echeneis naucrates]|nr:uncharacterized protein LOC115044982 isoform X2 [Echeneis naucrates]XP_029360286.1 uncharacterized protein LOC115044982 isoform X2 [Echeneis naucrates]XP_029360295.1 uncharacterized protein LOC115044982 isoform X2 [Echeneis naucrates]XP_029360304.1 uncharacterized protein LOC115044982 isoform X2 [Echeneis naucrates]XP_029360314.1 uncharacterized protein LOC115044982 isoform X2 [Echeneis naucrates]
MTGSHIPQCLAFLWLITQTTFVHSDLQFLERHEGESVVLTCVIDQRDRSPFGFYLKRSWLHPASVLFMYTQNEFTAHNDSNKRRLSISGDPSNHNVNVTISQLVAADTDRYTCEFVVDIPSSEDEHINGSTEFFLFVTPDASEPVSMTLVETCAGGSVVLPCYPPVGENSAVEGVSLKRQRGSDPVEVLYHSKRHRPSSASHFPAERVRLSSEPGPGGITYNLTLLQLQPEDSARYSCQLLVPGRSDSSTSLGRRVIFVSVQGIDCGCSNYVTLLYVLSAVVIVFIILGGFVIYKTHLGKARRSVKSHPQAPIYEEMVGVQSPRQKVASHILEEMETSEYRNCPAKRPSSENHYESPIGGFCPRT